jgi:VanZ family protein
MTHFGFLSVRRKLAIGVFVLALIVVCVLLLMPAASLPPTDVWDKLEHAGVFAGLSVLGLIAFPKRTSVGWLAFGLIGFGSVCEIMQSVSGRYASVEDAIANAIGVLLVTGLWRLSTSRFTGLLATTEYEK